MLVRLRDACLLLTVAGYSLGYAIPSGMLVVFTFIAEALSGAWRWVPTRLDRPLGAFALVALLSALFSPWRGHALVSMLFFALTGLIAVRGVAAYVRGEGERGLRVVRVWIAGGVAAAVWGLARFWLGGEPGASTALEPNLLGTTLAVAAILAAGVMINVGARERWALGAALAILLAGLVATLARAAWLGAASGLVTLLLTGPSRRARIALAGAVICGIALSVAGLSRWPAFSAELRTLADLQANRNRLTIWATVPRMIADYPILGTGFGTFGWAYQQYRRPDAPDPWPPFAHNIILNFIAETGVGGMVLFLVACAAALVGAWRRMIHGPPGSADRSLGTAVFAAMVAVLVNQLFEGTIMFVSVGYGFLALLALGGVMDTTPSPNS